MLDKVLEFLKDYWWVVFILGWGFYGAIVGIINACKGKRSHQNRKKKEAEAPKEPET